MSGVDKLSAAWFDLPADALGQSNLTQAFIQWKGTDVCLDFTCECGWDGHFDGYFAYVIQCGGCGRLWESQSHLGYRETTNQEGAPVVRPESDEEYKAKTGIGR